MRRKTKENQQLYQDVFYLFLKSCVWKDLLHKLLPCVRWRFDGWCNTGFDQARAARRREALDFHDGLLGKQVRPWSIFYKLSRCLSQSSVTQATSIATNVHKFTTGLAFSNPKFAWWEIGWTPTSCSVKTAAAKHFLSSQVNFLSYHSSHILTNSSTNVSL